MNKQAKLLFGIFVIVSFLLITINFVLGDVDTSPTPITSTGCYGVSVQYLSYYSAPETNKLEGTFSMGDKIYISQIVPTGDFYLATLKIGTKYIAKRDFLKSNFVLIPEIKTEADCFKEKGFSLTIKYEGDCGNAINELEFMGPDNNKLKTALIGTAFYQGYSNINTDFKFNPGKNCKLKGWRVIRSKTEEIPGTINPIHLTAYTDIVLTVLFEPLTQVVPVVPITPTAGGSCVEPRLFTPSLEKTWEDVKNNNGVPNMQSGSSNSNWIKWLQTNLNALGYKGTDGKLLVVNGDFGTNTKGALINFQKDKKLSADGVFGPKTKAELASACTGTAIGATETKIDCATLDSSSICEISCVSPKTESTKTTGKKCTTAENKEGICCITPGDSKQSVPLADLNPGILWNVRTEFTSLCWGTNKQIASLNEQINLFQKMLTQGATSKNIDLIIELTKDNKGTATLKKESITPDLFKNSINDKIKKLTEKRDTLNKDKYNKNQNWAENIFSVIACGYGAVGGITLAKGSGDCHAETAYGGTDYCGYCNAYEPFMQCTADRCGILGNCRTEAKEDGTGYLCLPAECTSTSSAVPHINNIYMEWYQGRLILNDTDNPAGTEDHFIKPTNDKVSYLVDTLNLTITTDQSSKCRYSFVNGTAFSEMTMSFDDSWKYPTTSTTMVDLTGLPLGVTHTIYIKCESTCGATNEQSDDSQYIKFTFEKRPDKLPPEIVRVVPDDKTQYLNHEDTSAVLEVWLNENGNCRYSTIAENEVVGNNLTTNWTQMAQVPTWNVQQIRCVQNQTCGYTNELGSFSLYNGSVYDNINTCARCYFTIDMNEGYELVDWDKLLGDAALLSQSEQDLLSIINTYNLNTAGLTGQSKMFHYMFRCEDTQRNIMPEEESYDYQIFTYPPFNMTIIDPEANQGYLMDVPVFVNTTRETVCKYSIDRLYTWDNMSFIDGENYGIEHRTILENLTNAVDPGRTHTIYVRCRDVYNLEVQDSRQFRVILDNQAPIVIRMLHELSDDSLMIETNEEAECVFSQDALKKCNYNFTLGQSFMSVDEFRHSYHWMPSILYYVKCKDKWDNYPGNAINAVQCTAIINPYDVPSV